MEEEKPMVSFFREQLPERFRTAGNAKSVVILVGVSTLSLAVIACVATALSIMGTGSREIMSQDARTATTVHQQLLQGPSHVRSPGFTVYDLPVQLCTDVAYCCLGLDHSGQPVVPKEVLEFIRILGSEWPARNRLFLTIGGHRLLVQTLDGALRDTAGLARRLADAVLSVHADGLAVYFQDLKPLQRAHRVHDLIMSIRGVLVAVVLPRDIRQQIRYYRAEIYVSMRDMFVIVPPVQAFQSKRPTFATCPEPRRSRRVDVSLEFNWQLSKTLLSPDVAAVDKAKDDGWKRSNVLIALSLEGFKFLLRNGSRGDVGSPAVYLRRVSYLDICRAPWQKWHDAESDCLVAWDGRRAWMSSLGPESGAFLAQIGQQGVAVFDIDFDDFRGQCGSKFPVLRALRAAMNTRPKVGTL
ncbi:unnamed protein product [Ixodes hexagonus]